MTEDGTQKIIITEGGQAYISEDGDTGTIYVQDAGTYKTEYEIVDESVEPEEYEDHEEFVAEIMEGTEESQDVYSGDTDDPEYVVEEEKIEENICTICERSFKTAAVSNNFNSFFFFLKKFKLIKYFLVYRV